MAPVTTKFRNSVVVLALVAATAAIAADQRPPGSAVPAPPDDKAIVHVLNRLGFGPGPGDVERVRRMGLAAYIETQLQPDRIPDTAMVARLAGFETLRMSSRELAEEYAIPALMRRRDAQRGRNAEGQMQEAQPPRRPPDAGGEARVMLELSQQKILRAVYSERQLDEVMTDFWFNHFNVFAGKGPTRMYLTEYERDVIRPHALGRFRDLLGAVAASPAMLFYLDNWQNNAPEDAETSMRPRRPPVRAPQPQARRRGINENYARELMELHTIGVDGGYTQTDIQEVARAFTGWTIDMPRQGGGFRFDPRLHDDGEKTVLGMKIPRGGGRQDGEQVLDTLARHPATATFIATKLVRRFVADQPPQALVERAAATFRKTDGDIREVVRTIVTSREFFEPAAYRAKIKTPFDFVASAVRATGIDVNDGLPLVRAMRQLGMPLYMCQPPIGYADTAEAWVNTGALLNRMNFAVMLTTNRQLRGGGQPLVGEDRILMAVLAGDVSPVTRETVAKATSEPQKIALLLGSPDFQKK